MTNPTTDKPAHTPEPQLLPCPFCGGVAAISSIGNDRTSKRSTSLRCTGCGCKLVVAAIRNNLEWTKGEVISAWNQRKGIDDPAKALPAMRKALEEAGSTIATARKFMPEGPRQMVLFNGKDVTYGEMCDLTNEIIRAALSLLGAKDGREGL